MPDRPLDDVRIDLSFEAAALGTTVAIPISSTCACRACERTGHSRSSCPGCGGAGSTIRHSGGIKVQARFPRCDGRGHQRSGPCTRRTGTGTKITRRVVTARIPPGTRDGARLRIPDPASDSGVMVTVHVHPHPYFTRDGDHLHLTLPITIPEAALGATVAVPALDRPVTIRIPPGTPHGRKLRVCRRGIPTTDGPGDLIITVSVDIPDHLNDAQRQALEALAAATPSPREALISNREP